MKKGKMTIVKEFFIVNLFLFLVFSCKPVFGLSENDFSFNLHAPYNFGGDLYPDPQTRTEAFWQYMDRNICELDGIGGGDCGPVKVDGIEIIRDSGKTGIIPKKLPDTQCVADDSPPCFTDQPNVAGNWPWLDGPVKHTANLGMETMIELSLWEMWWDYPDGARAYRREPADINVMLSLGRKALKRYDGDCDVNDDGDYTDNFEGTQENTSVTYPRIKYWQVGNEPGNNKWTFEETININGRNVLILAYATNEFAKILKADCPDCKLVLAGVGGDKRINYYQQFIYGPLDGTTTCTYNPCGYYRRLIEDLDFLRGTGVKNFDIFDFHHHHQQNTADTAWYQIKPKYDIIRRLLNETNHVDVPIWITEISSWTGAPDAEAWGGGVPYLNHTPEQQAAEIIKRYVYPFFLGVKKVFWSPSIIDTTYGGTPNGYFSNIGLIYKNGVKKIPSFNTYKLIVSKLKTFRTVTRVDMGDVNIYLFKFEFGPGGKLPVYIIWKEEGATNVNLSGKVVPPIVVTRLGGDITGEVISQVAINEYSKFVETSSVTPTPSATPTPSCPRGSEGNIDCDTSGVINNEDLRILQSAWTTAGDIVVPPEARRSPDLNDDGRVDEIDLTTLMRNWTP